MNADEKAFKVTFQINKQQTEEIDLYFHTAISVKGCKWVRGKSAHTDGFMCSQ